MQVDGNVEERAVRRDWEEQRGSLRRGRAKNEGFPFFIKSVAQSLGCDLSSSIGPERRAIHKRNTQKAIKMHPLLSRGNYSFSSLRSVLFVIILLHAFFKTPTKRHSQTHSTVFINSMSSFPNSKRVYFLLLESKFSLNAYFHVSLRSPLKQCPKSQESFKQRLEEQCIKYSQKRRQVSNSCISSFFILQDRLKSRRSSYQILEEPIEDTAKYASLTLSHLPRTILSNLLASEPTPQSNQNPMNSSPTIDGTSSTHSLYPVDYDEQDQLEMLLLIEEELHNHLGMLFLFPMTCCSLR